MIVGLGLLPSAPRRRIAPRHAPHHVSRHSSGVINSVRPPKDPASALPGLSGRDPNEQGIQSEGRPLAGSSAAETGPMVVTGGDCLSPADVVNAGVAAQPLAPLMASLASPARAQELPLTGGIDVTRTSIFLAALAGFAAVATDVFWPQALHLLPATDSAVHEWVVNSVPADLRGSLFDVWVSDVPIFAGLTAWIPLGAAAVRRRGWRGAATAGLAGAAYVYGGGLGLAGDPWLVRALKHAFHRARPSDIHRTFAFPSGHTTAAVLVVGMALFVLLPTVLPAEGGDESEEDGWEQVWRQVQSASPWLWAASGAVTALGRIGADAHWLSDTMAGACLGVCLVSLSAHLSSRLSGLAVRDSLQQ
eukprot:evm.model.scf_201EXC.10 EVM.evm.TU.scf_201EXC.10   scf_201EXC:115700-117830(+)